MNGTERRAYVRLLVQEDVIAYLVVATDLRIAVCQAFIKTGKVRDISIGGLSFEHIEDIRFEIQAQESLKGNIVLSVNRLVLSRLPCRKVYDVPVCRSTERQESSIPYLARRCGVQFEGLSESQTMQLKSFLKTCIRWPVE